VCFVNTNRRVPKSHRKGDVRVAPKTVFVNCPPGAQFTKPSLALSSTQGHRKEQSGIHKILKQPLNGGYLRAVVKPIVAAT
jgi:hypothetical protein